MFSTALREAEKYTIPVITSKFLDNGTFSCGLGSAIVVNDEGWIVTAAHIAQDILAFGTHQVEMAEHKKQCQLIESNPSLTPKAKRKQIGAIPKNPLWVVSQATLWDGQNNASVPKFMMDLMADIAIGQIVPFDKQRITGYAVFKNPGEPMPRGTSLCRLGFPFHDIQATYDQTTGQFTLGPNVLPVPLFPNEGIHTRIIKMNSPDGKKTVNFIETSSPGLRGQSGGPIFDRDGNIWAIQSRTQSFMLGFSPTIKQGNKEIVEHQFMHVGWGSHAGEVVRMLQDFKVKFRMSS